MSWCFYLPSISQLCYIHRPVTGVSIPFHCPLFKHKHHPFSTWPDNGGWTHEYRWKWEWVRVDQCIYIKSISIRYGVIHHRSFTPLFMHVMRRVCFKGLVNIGFNIWWIINHSQITLGVSYAVGPKAKTDCFGTKLWICVFISSYKKWSRVSVTFVLIENDSS